MKILLVFLMLLSASHSFAKRSEMIVNGRKFVVISPNTRPSGKRPLLLLLHGCKQNSNIILQGTRFDELAVQKNFYVIAPEQSVLENFDHCWNWFMASEQRRSPFNQMGQMIAGIQTMITSAEIDPNRIYLAGMSAGGVLGHNLASCYPDVFRGAALSAGLAYKIAEDLYEASTVLDAHHFKKPDYLGKAAWNCGRTGGARRLDRMLLIHGEEDKRVDPFHSRLISEVNQVTMDYYDDGKRNDSAVPVTTETQRAHRSRFSYKITEKRFKTINFTEQLILVKGMAHAWGGGKPISENFDPDAPSTSDFIINYFQL